MLHRDRTLLTPQMFRCLMHLQCMISPLRDALLVEDAASGEKVHNQPQVNASVQPVVSVVYDLQTAKLVCNSGAVGIPLITTYMHTVLMVDFNMIMNCSQSKLQTRTQLMLSPDSETPSPEQQRTLKCYSLLLKTLNKPLLQLHQMMSQISLDEKMPFAWMR